MAAERPLLCFPFHNSRIGDPLYCTDRPLIDIRSDTPTDYRSVYNTSRQRRTFEPASIRE